MLIDNQNCIYDRKLPADEWLSSYASTYVERDVRQLVNVGDLLAFQTFVRLCAGRVGQLVNFAALARVVDDLGAGPGGTMPVAPVVVYAGSDSHARTAAHQLSWRDVDAFKWPAVRA